MVQKRRAFHRWPYLKQHPSGEVHITGRCISMESWVRVIQGSRFLTFIVGVLFIAVGSFEFWGSGSSNTFENIIQSIRTIFHKFGLLSLQQYLGYTKPPQEVDILLIVLGIFMCSLRKSLGDLLGEANLIIFRWLLSRRIKITITTKTFTVHRWWRNLKLLRDAGSDLQARVIPVEEYFSPYSPHELEVSGFLTKRITHPPAIVEIISGMKRYKIIMTRFEDRAEALVASCNKALIQTNLLCVTA